MILPFLKSYIEWAVGEKLQKQSRTNGGENEVWKHWFSEWVVFL